MNEGRFRAHPRNLSGKPEGVPIRSADPSGSLSKSLDFMEFSLGNRCQQLG